MLTVTLATVGRLKEDYWRGACAEYIKRLLPFCKLNVVEVEEERLPADPSDAQITAALEAEGHKLLSRIPAGATMVALCIEGKGMSSVELAEQVSKWAVEGVSHVAFVIGSSCGLSDLVKQSARLRLSMSAMTFPHQMARVMVLEQLYRVMQINAGGKYHK